MPVLISQKRKQISKETRWKCPVCSGIHHFNSKIGCYRRSCSYKGDLERVK